MSLLFVLALASCGASQPTEITEPAASDNVNATVMSHDTFIAAALDMQVTVETCVQAKQVWLDGKASFYTQAEDGAYFLYQMPCTQEEYDQLSVGTRIRVTGKKAEWSGEVEITDAAFEIIDDPYTASPFDVTALLGAEELAAHQNELVSFTEMTVEPKTDADGNEAAFLYNWDGSGEVGSDLYFDASVNGTTVTFTVESDLCGAETDVYKAVQALKVGDVINLTGFLYWYNGANPHVTAVSPVA